jgi:hypothetical protein
MKLICKTNKQSPKKYWLFGSQGFESTDKWLFGILFDKLGNHWTLKSSFGI